MGRTNSITMSTRVILKDGIIYQHADEKGLSVDSLKEDLNELLSIQKDLERKKLPIYLLYDGSNVEKADSAVRAQAMYNMSSLNYKRAAIIGIKSVFLHQMAKFIILGMGKNKKIKIFKSKASAEKWLRSGQ